MTHLTREHEAFSQPEGLGHCRTVPLERIHECRKFLAAYNTVLDRKTEELIKVALSVASQCEWCIAFNVRKAFREEASRQEVIDAARMAVMLTGAPALECMDLLQNAVAKFEPESEESD
jgi:AhpD family alkylhydroperoxidase